MDKQKIELETLYTPYTLDCYSTFTFDGEEEYIIESLSEDTGKDLTYDDIDWTYHSEDYLNALAKNLVTLLQDNIIDDVILAIDWDGKTHSPREYNFTTDKCWLDITVDMDKLDAYIKANAAKFKAEHIRSCDGFTWLGNDNEEKLIWYIQTVSAELYSPCTYQMDQMEQVQTHEFIEAEPIKK